MKNTKFKKFLNNFYVKFTLLSILILLLIFVQMLFCENYTLDANPVIRGMYLSITLGASVYGFYTTRIYLLDRLAFGSTRKQIYNDFLKRTFIVLGAILFIVLYYILMYLLIYNTDQFAYFLNSREILYFSACYLLFAALGFFQGIFKLNFKIALGVFTLMSTLIILLIVFGFANYISSSIILIIAIAFFIVDAILIKTKNIKD